MRTRTLRIGFDFDNTIVCYDSAIGVLAEQMFRLPSKIPRTKLGLREHLRAEGREHEWTAFQGALYGPGMVHAQPFQGAIETMQALIKEGHQLTIVSHRSRVPYAGPPYDLHAAARLWISERLNPAGLFLAYERFPGDVRTVNFLETREAKVTRITELGCQVFLDDLPEVFETPGFPETTIGVLFAADTHAAASPIHHHITAWQQLPGLLKQLR